MSALSNVKSCGETDSILSDIGDIPDIPPVRSKLTGVSVRYEYDKEKKWFVFRASYGREDKAADVITDDGTFVYIAKRFAVKNVKGEKKRVLESLIPNILFVYTTAEKAEGYIKNFSTRSFCNFYYNHLETGEGGVNPPLVIPHREMMNFIRVTETYNEHVMFVAPENVRYKSGDKVRIIDGEFKDVEGRVARLHGQQRIVVELSNVGLVATAYVPTGFIKKVEM